MASNGLHEPSESPLSIGQHHSDPPSYLNGRTGSSQDVTVHENDVVPLSPVQPAPSSSRWTYITAPIRRVSRAVFNWLQGPTPPQVQKIKPILPRVQTWPIRMRDRYLPKRKHQLVLLLGFYFCWLLAFISTLYHSAFSGEIQGYGKPMRLSCIASYW